VTSRLGIGPERRSLAGGNRITRWRAFFHSCCSAQLALGDLRLAGDSGSRCSASIPPCWTRCPARAFGQINRARNK
jgi:hypothetical protein